MNYLLGMAQLGKKFALLLDVDKVLSTDELLNLEEVAAAASTPEAAASETVAETVAEEDSAKTAESPADSESKTRNAK